VNNFGPLALTRAFRAGSGSCQRQGGGAVLNMLSMLALVSLLSVLYFPFRAITPVRLFQSSAAAAQ
jgi:hypothetical protein